MSTDVVRIASKAKGKPDMMPTSVHPVAALFPMMTDAELDDLAADIKANGLNRPIVVIDDDDSGDRILVDGRNRLAACERAEVEPVFVQFQCGDPVAFIISENAARRHMNKGALAIVAAKAFPEASKGRGLKSPVAGNFPGIALTRIAEARTVLHHAPDLADMVLAGKMGLDKAYDEARERRGACENRNQGIEKIASEAPDLMELAAVDLKGALDQLRERVRVAALLKTLESEPDLHALVVDKRLPITEAIAAQEQRETDRRNTQQGVTRLLSEVVRLIGTEPAPEIRAAHFAENINPVFWPPEKMEQLSPQTLRHCADVLFVTADKMEQANG